MGKSKQVDEVLCHQITKESSGVPPRRCDLVNFIRVREGELRLIVAELLRGEDSQLVQRRPQLLNSRVIHYIKLVFNNLTTSEDGFDTDAIQAKHTKKLPA